MSLKYRILWVDDRKDEFTDMYEELSNFIKNLFFDPVIDFCDSVGESLEKIHTDKYDIIFSDFQIDEDKGDDFIENIRNANVNTEILFYTGQSKDLPKKQLNRVTFFNAQPNRWHELLLKKMKELIYLSIEKLQDLTNIRGLVMTEVSDLDVKMTDIIETYCVSEEHKNDLHKYIIKKIEDRTKELLEHSSCKKECVHVWKNEDFLTIIYDTSFESYTKARCINHILEKVESTKGQFLENYRKDIIDNRNILAHCKSEIKDGKEILITKNGEKQFGEKEFSDIRKNIMKYSNLFDKLLSKLKTNI